MRSVAEARVIECATAIAANVTAIRKLNAELRAAKCEEQRVDGEAGVFREPCVFTKHELGDGEGRDFILPWYHFKDMPADAIGVLYDYCPECVLQVDRFRQRKVLKAKKGGLVSALVRVVGIMERKASAPSAPAGGA